MKAETAYQVIQALPQSEVMRLYTMLGVRSETTNPKTKKIKKPIISDAEATEFLLKKFMSIKR